MTSNVGARAFSTAMVDDKKIREQVEADLRAQFKPEFLNRVDEIIIFNRLDPEQVKKIVELQLGLVQKRLAQQNITLVLTIKAKELLSREGYDPDFGARPVKRAIQRMLVNPLAHEIIQGKIQSGETIEVQTEGANSRSFVFRPAGRNLA